MDITPSEKIYHHVPTAIAIHISEQQIDQTSVLFA